jgi:hypothetical protein
MENQIKSTLDPEEMTPEEIKYFLKGLALVIDKTGQTQKEFAQGVTSSVNLSRILKQGYGVSSKKATALAKKAGMGVLEVARLGENAERGYKTEAIEKPVEKHIDNAGGGYLDVMTSVSRLVCATQKTEDRLRFWREMFGMLPVPALIIREGSVIYQNELSIVMGGDISGKDICALCIGGGCESKGDCPAHIANKNTNPTTGYRTIRGIRYKISVSHVRLNEMNYFIVLITSVRDEEV